MIQKPLEIVINVVKGVRQKIITNCLILLLITLGFIKKCKSILYMICKHFVISVKNQYFMISDVLNQHLFMLCILIRCIVLLISLIAQTKSLILQLCL